ncbi:hypothetical protein CK203_094302 [Vitis vinifera]|uniref:Uncharacterized protein n=1 Tax=Vitis vinifera TaxID=29760 RepID=A0A438DZC4_VITVI|nr:hypothetical protein CK203_094302 [Vitis vinifera]
MELEYKALGQSKAQHGFEQSWVEEHPANSSFSSATLRSHPSSIQFQASRASHLEDLIPRPLEHGLEARFSFLTWHGHEKPLPSPISTTRQRAFSAQVLSDSPSQATEAPRIPPSEGGEATGPSSPDSQRKYETRRPPTTLWATTSRPESLVRRPPAKRAKTSGPEESSRASEPLANSELPSDMSPESIIRHPMVTAPPLRATHICRVRPFHSELHFDQEAIEALDFYQSMTTRGVRSPTAIHFSINGHPGVLEWSLVSQRDMVHILSKGPLLIRSFYGRTSTWDALRRRGAALQPLSLQHSVQRR